MNLDWLTQAQEQGQLAPQVNPQVLAVADPSKVPSTLDNTLGALASFGNKVIPGGTEFGQTLGSVAFPDAARGIALPFSPAALRVAGRIPSPASSQLPQVASGGAGGNLPPAIRTGTSAANTGGGAGGGGRPPIDGSASRVTDPKGLPPPAQGTPAPVRQGIIEGTRNTLKQAHEGMAKLGASIIAATGLGTALQGGGQDVETAEAAGEVLGNELTRMATQDDEGTRAERDEIVRMALNIIRHQPVEALYAPDYEKYREELTASRDIFLREFDQHARPEEKADPSFWEKAAAVLPGVLAGGAVAGPLGALAGGAFWGQVDSGNRKASNRRNREEWKDFSERRLRGATDSLTPLMRLDQAQRSGQLQEAEWQRWNQMNALEDDLFIRGVNTGRLEDLQTAQQILENNNRLTAQEFVLGSLAGDQTGAGTAAAPTIQTDPKMAEHVVKHVVNSLPKEVEAVLAAQGVDLASFMMMPPSVEKTMVMANIANALLSQPPGSPIAQAMETFGRQYQTAGQGSSIQALAGF